MTYTILMAHPIFRPEATLAEAQNGFACWSRTSTQVTHGLMSAGMAQIDLARAIYAAAPADWQHAIPDHGRRKAAGRLLHTAQVRFDTVVNGSRQINDNLAASFFGAAETLVDGLLDDTGGDAATLPPGSAVASRALTPAVPAVRQKVVA